MSVATSVQDHTIVRVATGASVPVDDILAVEEQFLPLPADSRKAPDSLPLEDMTARGLATGDPVRLVGEARSLDGFVAAAYPIARGCCAAYFPEASGLIALEAFDPASRTPAYKSTPIDVVASR